MARPTAATSGGAASVTCTSCARGSTSISNGVPDQNGHTTTHPVVGVHDPVVGGLFGLERRAQQARALEAAEPGLLLGDLARHERDAEQLAVRVLEAGPGLAAVVDDDLRVADLGAGRVGLHAVADRRHGHRRLGVVEVGPRDRRGRA